MSKAETLAANSATAPAVAEAVRALADADFSAVAKLFSEAGFAVALPAPGILQIKAAGARRRASVLVSVGVHGDETAPIEMLAQLLDALSRQAQALAVDLMVCVGNVGAIRAGKRFIDADLNRMFRAERGALADAVEAQRADAMIAATEAFFADAGPVRWHLDLHTAIRPSVYPTFAIVPELIADAAKAGLIGWLGQAAIGAIIMNPQSAGTYSYYSAEHCGAAASTVELGRVGTLGQNDLSLFADVALALDGLLRGAAPAPAKTASHVFKVAQEIIKLSDDFRMAFDRSTQNFTSLPAYAVIASDGDTVYTVRHAEELVVFPNPDVRVGLRAGLMVVRVS
ncbi:succinylglutamate desuccinylase [Janthinobacterium fluminis]|uniref:Succinylglutamate desuccinylase n=1 Tax=Janthinobacterium fluminis TaxID=2987524 RepID=A0ABT5K3W4_9BURK|nr:succinylglutamate desuccinylase [Janthinobacterium fluminis]MDC8759441.1 succinylglutamate desuccinylase [Janthinobacterium fluminis]